MKLALAPMVDLTHPAFRQLVAEFGGCDLFFTEMVNVRVLKSIPPEKDPYLTPANSDRPLIVQLVGKEPEDFGKAVDKLEKLQWFSGYNLNFGCTKGKIQRYGWGASLLKEPYLIREIIRTVKASTSKPVSVKIRSPHGHDISKLMRLAEVFEEENVDFIVFHPRAPEDGFRRPARWEELSFLKRRVTLKVIGNGDVFSPQKAVEMVEKTGVDGVMIGRAALIRPWIFRDIKYHIKNGCIPPAPSLEEPVKKMGTFIQKFLPENWWIKRLDNFLYWYLQNTENALFYVKVIRKVFSFEEKLEKSIEFLSRETARNYPVTPFLPA